MEPRVINAGNSGPFTLDGTRTFLVGQKRLAVIDPGPEVDAHLGALLSALHGAEAVSVVVTHWHADHAALAPRLAAALGVEVQGPGRPAGRTLAPGDTVDTDEGPLIAVPTPGHAQDHLALHHPGSGAVFVGDLLLGLGDTTWVGEYLDSVGDYLQSLTIVRALLATVLYPTHGPPITGVDAALDRYEAHRSERIEQIARVRNADPTADVEGILRQVYGSVPEGLGAAARSSINATLHYLDTRTVGP